MFKKLLFLFAGISASTAFVVLRPHHAGKMAVRNRNRNRNRNRSKPSNRCPITAVGKNRKNTTSSLSMSGFDYLVETIIPSTLLITAFIVALQRLSTVESSIPESFDFESNRFTLPDIILNHPFSTANVDVVKVDTVTASEPALQEPTVETKSQDSVVIPAEKSTMNQLPILPVNSNTSPVAIRPKMVNVKSSARPTGGGGMREDLSAIKKTIANTLSGEREKISRLKATEPKTTPINAPDDTQTVETSPSSIVYQLPKKEEQKITGRKRKLVAKVLKKIVMPWRKWASL